MPGIQVPGEPRAWTTTPERRLVAPNTAASAAFVFSKLPPYSPPATALNHHRSCPRMDAARHSADLLSAPPRKQGVTISR